MTNAEKSLLMAGHNIIVIGASSGGVEALIKLVKMLPRDLPAAVFVVLHTAPHRKSMLPEILSRSGPLKASHPVDHEEIQQGRIYVAPPDRHLMIFDGHVGTVRGPKECRHRPAVNPLFRSAANAYGNRVVGVVLTGALDDGAAGLLAIKEKGGVAVVQDPNDAFFPDMPLSAMKYVTVDHCVPIVKMSNLLDQLARDPIDEQLRAPLTRADMSTIPEEPTSKKASGLTCPECSAAMFQSRHGRLLEFRCRVGHRFSLEGLLDGQLDILEKSLWSSLNAIEERSALILLLAQELRNRGENDLADREDIKANENDRRAQHLRHLLSDDGGTAWTLGY